MAIMRAESGNASDYLTCEKWPVYALMMLAGGYFGAFTYAIRGGVFCNAQSGNVVLLSMALSRGEWGRAGYLLIPITAYCLGAFVSEAAARGMGKRRLIRWETALVLFEMLAVLFLGALPEAAPVQITQVLVNFMCSMQYNTFRQAQGIPMATTFCTNHIRQVGISLYGLASGRGGDAACARRLGAHLGMLGAFAAGGVMAAFLCGLRQASQAAEPQITGDLLASQLRSVQELVTVSYYYTNMGRFENQVDFYGWKVPFTTKSFIVSYDGVIKAGVDLEQLQVSIGDGEVTVTLPESRIISHEIPEDSLEVFDESDNLFNHITIEDYTAFTQDQKSAMEQRAVDGGLLDRANQEARTAVDSLLRIMPGLEEYTLTVK